MGLDSIAGTGECNGNKAASFGSVFIAELPAGLLGAHLTGIAAATLTNLKGAQGEESCEVTKDQANVLPQGSSHTAAKVLPQGGGT